MNDFIWQILLISPIVFSFAELFFFFQFSFFKPQIKLTEFEFVLPFTAYF